MSAIEDLASRLTTVLSDPALTNALMASCPALRDLINAPPPRPAPVPLPALDDVTALQMTWFDNGKNATGDRFKIALEVFVDEAVPGRDPACTSLTSAAFTAEEMSVKLRRWRVAGMDDWRDDMEAIVAAHPGKEFRFIPIVSKMKGTTYFPGQFVLMKLTSRNAPEEATLFVGGQAIQLTGWTTTTATGKRVSGAATHQIRLDRTGSLTKWGSQFDD